MCDADSVSQPQPRIDHRCTIFRLHTTLSESFHLSACSKAHADARRSRESLLRGAVCWSVVIIPKLFDGKIIQGSHNSPKSYELIMNIMALRPFSKKQPLGRECVASENVSHSLRIKVKSGENLNSMAQQIDQTSVITWNCLCEPKIPGFVSTRTVMFLTFPNQIPNSMGQCCYFSG